MIDTLNNMVSQAYADARAHLAREGRRVEGTRMIESPGPENGPAALMAKALDEAQARVSAVLQAEALLPPGYRVVYDTTPVRQAPEPCGLDLDMAAEVANPDADWQTLNALQESAERRSR